MRLLESWKDRQEIKFEVKPNKTTKNVGQDMSKACIDGFKLRSEKG